MKLSKLGILLFLFAILAAGHAFAGDPLLKQEEVIALANAAAIKDGIDLTHFSPPQARYVSKNDAWFVHFQGKVLKPGAFFEVRLDDKTKTPQILPGK